MRAGDTRAVARAISLVEDEAALAQPLLAALFPHAGKALVVGVTGPPGAGKSSLVDRLTALLRAEGRSVGIVAVDPSSPFSGGAILGDRIRMQAHATDPGVFIRSMATRGHLGGLAAATDHVVTVLSAAGKDVILVETVGVGQDEVEIVGTADVSVVVLVPGLGDEVQALKAGIMEIADVFVVNKADREGVDRVVAEIESMLSLVPSDAVPPAIVRTVATRDEGTRALVDAVLAFHERARDSGALARKRRMTLGRQLQDAVTRRLAERAFAALGPGEKDALVERLVRRELDPWSAADEARGKGGARVKILKIDHLGIAVRSLAEAAARLRGARLPGRGDPRRPDREGPRRLPGRGRVAARAAGADRAGLGDRPLPREALGAAPRLRARRRHRRGARRAQGARRAARGRDAPRGRGRLPRGLRAPEGRLRRAARAQAKRSRDAAAVVQRVLRRPGACRPERTTRNVRRPREDRVVSPVGPGTKRRDRRSDG